jgi:hypothetical protein
MRRATEKLDGIDVDGRHALATAGLPEGGQCVLTNVERVAS